MAAGRADHGGVEPLGAVRRGAAGDFLPSLLYSALFCPITSSLSVSNLAGAGALSLVLSFLP